MEIFISWSGERSKILAKSLKDWIPLVIHNTKTFMSKDDIKSGTQWMRVISQQLEKCNFGIICLTPENFKEPWINFEAGALAKHFDSTHVCPCLFDLNPSDLTGPLSQYMATKFRKPEIKKLVQNINSCIGDNKLDNDRLNKMFDAFWPALKQEIKNIPVNNPVIQVRRSERDMLEEILTIVRDVTKTERLYESFDEMEPKECPSHGCGGTMLYEAPEAEYYCTKCGFVEE